MGTAASQMLQLKNILDLQSGAAQLMPKYIMPIYVNLLFTH